MAILIEQKVYCTGKVIIEVVKSDNSQISY